eukprot:scaffold1122_cov377-Prasinococcus_capsulatus_cf.AAC.10
MVPPARQDCRQQPHRHYPRHSGRERAAPRRAHGGGEERHSADGRQGAYDRGASGGGIARSVPLLSAAERRAAGDPRETIDPVAGPRKHPRAS